MILMAVHCHNQNKPQKLCLLMVAKLVNKFQIGIIIWINFALQPEKPPRLAQNRIILSKFAKINLTARIGGEQKKRKSIQFYNSPEQ